MRAFLTFIVILAFALGIFIFGNMLRCLAFPGDKCPGLCVSLLVENRNPMDDNIKTKNVCRAPDVVDYWQMLGDYANKLKYKF